MEKKINRILIIGKGNSGIRFNKILKKKNSVKLISSRKVKNLYLAKKIFYDLIIISSPASFHIDHLKKFLNFSNKFLIEKPLYCKSKEIKALKKITKKNNKKFFINYNMRELEIYKSLKLFLKKNKNKKINYIKFYVGQNIKLWRKKKIENSVSVNKFLGGGALLELSHEIDLAYYNFGIPDKSILISKKLDNIVNDVDDLSIIIFYYKKKNFLLEINLNMLDHETKRYVEIIYSDLTIKFDAINSKIIKYKKNNIEKIIKLKNNLKKTYEIVPNKILNNNFKNLCDIKFALKYGNLLTSQKSII